MSSFVQDFIDGYTKAARDAGRPTSVQLDVPTAYLAGKQAALAKYAGISLHDGLDLAGLGLLGAPLVHDLVSDEKTESPTVHRIKKLTELGGLGVLAGSTLSKLH